MALDKDVGKKSEVVKYRPGRRDKTDYARHIRETLAPLAVVRIYREDVDMHALEPHDDVTGKPMLIKTDSDQTNG